MPLSTWLRVGAPEIVFAYVLVMTLAHGGKLLNDPDTFWHLEVGRRILDEGAVTFVDRLTYSQADTHWVDQSWLFDAGLALTVRGLGWPGAIALASIWLAWLYWIIARQLERDGSSPWSIILVGLLVSRVGQIHFLVRPHLLTWGFCVATFAICRAAHRGKIRALWAFPPMMSLWANCHGGFLAGLLILATAIGAHALSGHWDSRRLKELRAFALAFIGGCAAPLLTPYGIDLYRHVYELLFSSGLTKLSQEFQPYLFSNLIPGPFEWAIIALVALPKFSRERVSFYDLAHALVWLHLGLVTVRYSPIFGFAVAPMLARLLDGIFPERNRAEASDPLPTGVGLPLAASLGIVIAAALGAPLGKLDPERWPLDALPAVNEAPKELPLFHEQDWGGMVEAMTEPRRLAFIDSRFEVFGVEFIENYIKAIQGNEEAWEALDDKWSFGLVWVRPDRGLARRLAGDTHWRVLHQDPVSVLFQRVR